MSAARDGGTFTTSVFWATAGLWHGAGAVESHGARGLDSRAMPASFPTGLVRADLDPRRPRFVETPWGAMALYLEGEELLAVAAASVIAREQFLLGMRALSEAWALDLAKGAGHPVDAAARRFVALHGAGKLGEVAKLHFKNTQKLGLR